MKNESLVKDYLDRASARLKAIGVLQEEKSWADVVRESQEVIELSLKALLRASGVEVPRIHDVSPVLEENAGQLPKQVRPHLDKVTRISRALRRDRELAFYGSEDLTRGSSTGRKTAGRRSPPPDGWWNSSARHACNTALTPGASPVGAEKATATGRRLPRGSSGSCG